VSTATADPGTDISELEAVFSEPPRCQTWVIDRKCNAEAAVTIKICCCNSIAHLCRRHFEWLKSGGQVRCTNCGCADFEWIAL